MKECIDMYCHALKFLTLIILELHFYHISLSTSLWHSFVCSLSLLLVSLLFNGAFRLFFFFSTGAQLKCFYYPVLETGGGKRTMDTTSPLLTSNTLLQSWTWCIIFNIINERKIYWKMYPSECGRALKYVTCKGKNWCSIIPKRDAEKRQLLQRPNPNILPTILPKAPIILCRSDNRCVLVKVCWC